MAGRDMLVHVFGRRVVSTESPSGTRYIVTLPDGTELLHDVMVELLAIRLYDTKVHNGEPGRAIRVSFDPPYDMQYTRTRAGTYLEEIQTVPLTPALRKKFRKGFRERAHYNGPRFSIPYAGLPD